MGKANKTNKQTKQTNMFKLFWPHYEGIISKNKKDRWGENQQKQQSNYSGHHMKGSYQQAKHTWDKQQTTKTNKYVQTSLAQGPPEPD